MGWFVKVEVEQDEGHETRVDLKNPYSVNVEEEGEFVTIIHEHPIVHLDDEEEGEEDGSTSNSSDISE